MSYGPSANPKYTTTYFRHRFAASGVPDDLTLRLRVDDGAVAYLNGVEVARFNLPSGPVSVLTRAPDAISGPDERLDRPFTVDPSLIRVGTNVLSVEVHQNTLGSSDLSFLASLSGSGSVAATTTVTPTTAAMTTTATTTVAPTTTSTTTTIAPTTTSTTTTIAPTTTAAPTTTVAPTTTAAPATAATTIATPPPPPPPPPAGLAASIAPDAVWSYLDDGSDQGAGWNSVQFDDATWMTGVGEFGYGDGDERTVVTFGPMNSRKYPTTYFRHRFTATGTPTELTLTLRIDDGAIVRINGVEAHRFNMPATGVTYETRALDAIWGAAERLDRAITLDPTLVRAGTNVITVEVHQDTYGSSDLTFLASLTGRI